MGTRCRCLSFHYVNPEGGCMIWCCATRFWVAEDGAVFRSTGAPSVLPAVNDILPLPGQIPSRITACCCAGELPLSPTPEGIFHAAGSIKNYIFGRVLHGYSVMIWKCLPSALMRASSCAAASAACGVAGTAPRASTAAGRSPERAVNITRAYCASAESPALAR